MEGVRMQVQEYRCPYCGARLDTNLELKSFFCKYCGGRIYVDDKDSTKIELRKMEHTETMKQLDNAHDFRTMDHIERIQAEANSLEKFKTEQKNKGGFRKGCVSVVLIVVLGFVILTAIAIFATNRNTTTYDSEDAEHIAIHEREVQRLTAIEQEVLDEIAKGDYAKALVKANTIHYTAPSFVGIGVYGAEKKWDDRREEIIKSIYQVSGIETPTPVPTPVAIVEDATQNPNWPKSEIAKMIPVPGTTNIDISWERESGFYLEVKGYSPNSFKAYSNACWDKGFTLDYEKGDTYFRAYHPDGFYLNLSFRGNVMSVRLEKKNKQEK